MKLSQKVTVDVSPEHIAPPHADARQRNTFDSLETYYDHLHEWYALGMPQKKKAHQQKR